MTPDQLKAEILEEKELLAGRIEALSESVQSSVATMKDNVEEKVESIKRKLSLSELVKEYPLQSLGGACALGALIGSKGKPNNSRHVSYSDELRPQGSSPWCSALKIAIPIATALIASKSGADTNNRSENNKGVLTTFGIPLGVWLLNSFMQPSSKA